MEKNAPVDVVRAYQDAWTSRDMSAARQYLAEGISFDSPQRHIDGVDGFIAMLEAFVQRVEPRWEMIAATAGTSGVLILHNLFTLEGTPAACADHFTVENGKITSETLTFDPRPFASATRKKTA